MVYVQRVECVRPAGKICQVLQQVFVTFDIPNVAVELELLSQQKVSVCIILRIVLKPLPRKEKDETDNKNASPWQITHHSNIMIEPLPKTPAIEFKCVFTCIIRIDKAIVFAIERND